MFSQILKIIVVYFFWYISFYSGVPEEVVPADPRAEETDGETQKHGFE